MTDGSSVELEDIVRSEGRRIVAVLARALRDLQLAEDSFQDATVAALEVWSRNGVPANPSGWLYVAARRKALDLVRREVRRPALEVEAGGFAAGLEPDPPEDDVVRDDQLRLLFVVCHPALSAEGQVALALKMVAGLSTSDIARGLLATEAAMARRLTRAKDKVRISGIGFELPSTADLPSRLAGVCGVIHQVYTAGHAASGAQLVRHDLCDEAVRLAELLCELLPGEPQPEGLLALLLLTDSRRSTRTGDGGDPLPLREQDRSGWDHAAIERGIELLERSLRRTDGMADPYQLQAAIAAQHAAASDYDATDWGEIVHLYDLLEAVHPSWSVTLGAAVARAELHGADAGLERLCDVPEGFRGHHWHTARAELLSRLGRHADALDAFAHAVSTCDNEAERRYLERRRAAEQEAAAAEGGAGGAGA